MVWTRIFVVYVWIWAKFIQIQTFVPFWKLERIIQWSGFLQDHSSSWFSFPKKEEFGYPRKHNTHNTHTQIYIYIYAQGQKHPCHSIWITISNRLEYFSIQLHAPLFICFLPSWTNSYVQQRKVQVRFQQNFSCNEKPHMKLLGYIFMICGENFLV